MNRFATIALALQGPRASGRTYNMIRDAPKDAFIIVRDSNHADYIKHMTHIQNRSDLNTILASDNIDAFKGQRGPFVIDHHTVEWLLFDAAKLINPKLLEDRINKALKDKKYVEKPNDPSTYIDHEMAQYNAGIDDAIEIVTKLCKRE